MAASSRIVPDLKFGKFAFRKMLIKISYSKYLSSRLSDRRSKIVYKSIGIIFSRLGQKRNILIADTKLSITSIFKLHTTLRASEDLLVQKPKKPT